ncbi:hypothetical protein FJY71_04565 [candidate division WOR-3 bacterium]|nr:hypothetical protein [candidate division WOR-3 bacterium]
MRNLLPLALGALVLCGCPGSRDNELGSVNDFVYQLLDVDPLAIGVSAFDLAIVDYSVDGTDEGRLTADDVADLKDSPGGRKTVLAYLNVGEAEDYRWYWDEAWDADADGMPDPGAPEWLGPAEPDWPGCYAVHFWHPEWQAIVRDYLDTIIATGFDGVYLDLVDVYEYWGPDGESGLERASAERDMVRLVVSLAELARGERGVAGFIVIPQNGEKLGRHRDYFEAVDGVGREDVWYVDDEPVPVAERNDVITDLDRFRRAGKVVLVTDYVRTPWGVADFYARARAQGYVPYATSRDLDSLTVNPGQAPD